MHLSEATGSRHNADRSRLLREKISGADTSKSIDRGRTNFDTYFDTFYTLNDELFSPYKSIKKVSKFGSIFYPSTLS